MASTPPMTPTGEEIQQNLAGAHLLSLLRSTSNTYESEQSRQSALPTAPGVHSHLQIELDAKRGQYQPIFSNRPLTIPSPIARIFDVPAPLAAVVGPRLSAGGDDKSATLPSTADDRELFRLPSNPWGPSPVPTPTGSSVAPTPTNGHTNPGRAFEWDTSSNHGNVYAPSLMTDIPHGMFPMHGHQPFPPQAYMHNPEAMSLHHQSWQFMQLHMQQQQQLLASMQQHGWVHPPPGFNPPGFGGSPIRTAPPPPGFHMQSPMIHGTSTQHPLMHEGLIHHPQHDASPAKGNPHDRQQIYQSLASKSSQGAAASTPTEFFQPAPPPERHPAAEQSGVNYHDVMTSLQAGMMRTTIQDQHHPTSSMLPGTPPPPPRRVSHSSSIASSTPFVAEGTSGQRTSRHGSPAPPPPPGSRMTPVTAGAQRVRNKTPLTALTARRNAPRQPTCRASLDVLNRQLVQLAEDLSPSDEERRRHQATLEVVRALLIKEWPHAKVHLFGSAANGLSVRNSTDIDVCLEILDVEENQGKIVERLGEIFTDAGMDSVKAISHARVPVCKAKCEGISFDVTVNNMLALVNTKMLKDYTDLDPRLRQLVFLVKWWAKRRRVNDSYRGTLSSYAYVLMCINLLQRRDPPILPVLQSLLPGDTSPVTVASAEQQEISDWAETETGMSAEAVLSTSETLNSGEDKRPGTHRKSSMMIMNSARMSETFEIKEERGGGTLTELSVAGPSEGSSGCYEQLPSRNTSDAAKKSTSSEFLVSRISMGCSPAEVQPGVSTASVYRKQVGPWRCEFYDDIKSMVSFGSGNKECLAELLVAFFDYWAFRHDYPNMAVSIRIPGGLMTKAEKKWTIRQGSERHLVCIEDPFELSHDLGRTIDRDSVGGLRREFERAALVLANEEDPVTLLFQEYM